ncbi:glycine betaine/L-proline ABC transporter permease ProW [Insolitispirillum peregrinum]|uniref:Glycine betaine/proline transport system permease protein n=1 Tax=Insolitispirillum peregrinum TaxID=80876 RepID=A0A1N7P5T4_9PROT|nr:glycine betaine/L-proline ABC transporter permease ProW [Insolitispirillum peregrinum]SIT05934.1 glycine betaine/proline transport system permease protein [Insolitispirillum peregrinum]
MTLNDLLNPFQQALLPVDLWVTDALSWLVDSTRPFFQSVRWPIDQVLVGVQSLLLAIPQTALCLLVFLLAWQVAGRKTGILSLAFMLLIGAIGAWSQAMVTLSLVLTAVLFCTIIGIPLGIALARSDRAERWIRPLLDAMQTTPAFVYLVPIVMLFGIGNVPGVVVTIIFALPPLVRLTNLGIRQVPTDVIEASHAFGASPMQLLMKVQLPLAMRTIMAGLNQTLMLALSMVVIASMIAVGGLGQMVLRGIGRLDMGLAAVGGLGIVLLAIVLDRLTQALGTPAKDKGWQNWKDHGPAGFLFRLAGRRPA